MIPKHDLHIMITGINRPQVTDDKLIIMDMARLRQLWVMFKTIIVLVRSILQMNGSSQLKDIRETGGT